MLQVVWMRFGVGIARGAARRSVLDLKRNQDGEATGPVALQALEAGWGAGGPPAENARYLLTCSRPLLSCCGLLFTVARLLSAGTRFSRDATRFSRDRTRISSDATRFSRDRTRISSDG